MAITYRAGEAADLPQLVALGKAFAQEQIARWPLNKLADGYVSFIEDSMQMAISHPAARVFVAGADDRVVGYVLGQITEPPPQIFEPKPYVFVSDLYVLPELRGQGIGTTLVENCRGWALVNGIGRMSLVLGEANPALRIYQRLGFNPVERLLFWLDPELGQ